MLENLSADECAYVRFGQKRTFRHSFDRFVGEC